MVEGGGSRKKEYGLKRGREMRCAIHKNLYTKNVDSVKAVGGSVSLRHDRGLERLM